MFSFLTGDGSRVAMRVRVCVCVCVVLNHVFSQNCLTVDGMRVVVCVCVCVWVSASRRVTCRYTVVCVVVVPWCRRVRCRCSRHWFSCRRVWACLFPRFLSFNFLSSSINIVVVILADFDSNYLLGFFGKIETLYSNYLLGLFGKFYHR